MSKLDDADIESRYPDTNNFIRSITSVKRLSLCIRSLNAEELNNLKLCPCDTNWSKLLARLLEKSPSLRELEICLNDDHKDTCVDPPLVSLENELNPVPECMRSSLETFKWKGIHGSQKEVVDVVKYILRNACCLETAAVLSQSTPETEDKCKMMIQELLHSFLSSATCQLVLE
ncbi:PREDICTED: LOW QUALITY PROTEIN: putative F-box/FBD/LRR-repeat protein At4g00315 [Camelina sativa]|uniref:LOW QUALITY PROTEIN: putative F-box/FBD/LRR-repeat protein At4g00315 n=1 Tax=Camelina sativa TaxID=90675 RepID=A0ABM1QIM5_CAMSA|nr:PREDICTED: LOW QUALITY PROTEIN: putative F-box/FBD/LRR-repeat protein At4g00315 [Camelina sativa]